MSVYIIAVMCGVLLLCSAFFSGSETAVMASNRYKVQHLAKNKNTAARKLMRFQEKPQALLGMILIGNTFANMLLSALVTWATIQHLGEAWVLLATCMLTLCVLVFAELIPKTIAAYFADKAALRVAPYLVVLLWCLRPIVAVVNNFVDGLLHFWGLSLQKPHVHLLSNDELKGLIQLRSNQKQETTQGGEEFSQMLVGVLDFASMTVNDVMLNRHEIEGIDLQWEEEKILQTLSKAPRMSHLVYEKNLAKTLGVLQLNHVLGLVDGTTFTKRRLLPFLQPVQYVPEGTALTKQFRRFHKHNCSIALVVDEYGAIAGLVNMEAIIEEIIGEFSLHDSVTFGRLKADSDGGYVLGGQLLLRDINRYLDWRLPNDGPVTLSGWIIECLGCIPEGPVGFCQAGYKVEVIKMSHSTVRFAKVWCLDDRCDENVFEKFN